MAKRSPPYSVQALLRFDKYISDEICRFSDRFQAVRSFKRQCKTLEYSCHGIVWLCAWLIFIWFAWTPSLFQMQVNFFIGLILDIIFVAILKAIFRRRRPAGNKPDALEISVDKFSFPSGHVSRAVFIAYFFLYLYPINLLFIPPLFAWCFSVSVSRILLRRHHLLDVLAGVILGVFEGFVMNYLWLSARSAFYIIEWITDEKFEVISSRAFSAWRDFFRNLRYAISFFEMMGCAIFCRGIFVGLSNIARYIFAGFLFMFIANVISF